MPFTTDVLDNFTSADTDLTYFTPLITDHYADTGQRVVKQAAVDATFVFFKNNRIYFRATSGVQIGYVAHAAADAAKYTATLQVLSNLGSVMIGGRGTDDINSAYYFGIIAGFLRLYRLNSGAFTKLVEVPYTPTVGAHTISLTTTGTGASVTLHCEIDGAAAFSDYVDTDASRLTALGNLVIYGDGGGSGMTATTGIHVESVQRDVPSAAVAVSFTGTVPTRNGIVGSAASFANAGFFAGDNTPFAYSNVGAALPAGLTLDSSTGIISGTPTTAGTTSGMIVRATDTASNIANTNSYSIVIAATNAAPTFPGNISNISGTNGSAITPVNVSGQFSDTDTLTYSASPAGTAWPAGITINSSTGIISGTPSTAATTTGCKVRATDTAAQTVDSNAFNFVIAAAGSTVTITSPSQGGKYVANGQQRASVACNVTALDKSTHAVLERKTGLTSSPTGVVSYTSTMLTAGTERLFLVKADADDKDLGAFFATPV
jgi:hypothetical protein